MDFFFPIAGVSINLLNILGLGGIIGLLSGLFGVGGGFLMTPMLIMMGIPPVVAAASGTAQFAGAATTGSLVHYKQGNIDIKMGLLMLFGSAISGVLGTFIIKWLRQIGNADFIIQMCYFLLLSLVGSLMFYDSIKYMRRKNSAASKPQWESRFLNSLPFQMDFKKSGVTMSAILPFSLGLLVGLMAAIMGVGGGFLMVPAMTYMLRMPIKIVFGTSLFQIMLTSILITILQAAINHTVDIFLAIIILIGSTIGVQFGARIAQKLSGEQLKILLAILILLVAINMLTDLLVVPSNLLSPFG